VVLLLVRNHSQTLQRGNPMAEKSDGFDFEIVNENDLQFTQRGRKSNANPAIIKAISKLTAGQVLKVTSLKVDLKAKDAKSRKATVSAQLRSAGKAAGVVVRIQFTLDGVPTVRRS